MLNDIGQRVDLQSQTFATCNKIWTRAITWLMKAAPGLLLVGEIRDKSESLKFLGCSSWFRSLTQRPWLVQGHQAALVLHKFFITEYGCNRSLNRALTVNGPTPAAHPRWLDEPFKVRVVREQSERDRSF